MSEDNLWVDFNVKYLLANRWDVIGHALEYLERQTRDEYGVFLNCNSVGDEFWKLGAKDYEAAGLTKPKRAPDIAFSSIEIPDGAKCLRLSADRQGNVTSQFIYEEPNE